MSHCLILGRPNLRIPWKLLDHGTWGKMASFPSSLEFWIKLPPQPPIILLRLPSFCGFRGKPNGSSPFRGSNLQNDTPICRSRIPSHQFTWNLTLGGFRFGQFSFERDHFPPSGSMLIGGRLPHFYLEPLSSYLFPATTPTSSPLFGKSSWKIRAAHRESR